MSRQDFELCMKIFIIRLSSLNFCMGGNRPPGPITSKSHSALPIYEILGQPQFWNDQFTGASGNRATDQRQTTNR